jgi:Ser/Thr protein kinase RdoA (MazF antagonist)
MLEKSILLPAEIPALLTDRYDFTDVSVGTPIDGGSANLWSVSCDGQRYVLKEFQSSYTAEDVSHEPQINHALLERSIPVVSFVCTQSGEYIWRHRDRTFHLQQHAKGKPCPQHEGPPWLIDRSIRLLSDIHENMPDIPLPIRWPTEWYDFDIGKLENDFDALLEKATSLDGTTREVVVADLTFRRETVSELGRVELADEMFTYRLTHGDYHLGQLLIFDREVSAIVDFSAAGSLPVVWVIIRSFTLSEPDCSDGSMPVAKLAQHLEHYLDRSPLTLRDVENMLPLYYCQLLRSKYGYREFLNGTEDPDDKLAFGMWRTSTCRWLNEHLQDASSDLVSALSPSLRS